MSDEIQEKLRVRHPRCPYCHDNIVGGEDNYACHECLTWHHSECWNERGACVTCGNSWKRVSSTGPLAPPLPKVCEVCADAGWYYQGDRGFKQYCLWCLKGKRWLLERRAEDVNKLREKKRQEKKETKNLLPCKHKFNPLDMCCDDCGLDAREHARSIFGAAYPGDKEVEATVARGWESGRDFLKEKFQALRRKQERAERDRAERAWLLWSILLAIAAVLSLLVAR